MRVRRFVPIALLAIVVLLSACSAATPQKRAAQMLETIGATVDGGMQAAASFYKEGRVYNPTAGAWVVVSESDVLISDADWVKLAGLHEKYRRCGKTAALAIHALGPNRADPLVILADVNAAAKEVLALIDLFRKAGAK